MKLTLIGQDNILMRFYVHFFYKLNIKDVLLSAVILPNNMKSKSKSSIKLRKSMSFHNFTDSKSNLRIPKLFWNRIETRNLLESYFLKQDIDLRSFKLDKQIPLNNVSYVNTKSMTCNELSQQKLPSTDFFLNTGSFIYNKSLLDSLQRKVVHVHPGYLPELRGGDGLLWSIYLKEEIGLTLFKMNEFIDEGEIYDRKKIKFNRINNSSLKKLTNQQKYNFIFSSLDPVFRSHFFWSTAYKKLNEDSLIINEKNKGIYKSFMTENELEKVFFKIF